MPSPQSPESDVVPTIFAATAVPYASTVVAQNTTLMAIGYLAIGLQAAIVPVYVDYSLGLGATLAGAALSAQPLATLISRSTAGSYTNRFGPRLAVMRGLLLIVVSGLCFTVATLSLPMPRMAHYTVLILSRLLLGWGISWVSAAGAAWAIGRAGDIHTSKVFVWSGVATYGSLALGAPLGLSIGTHWAPWVVGLLVAALCLCGILFAARIADIAKPDEQPLHIFAVLQRVAPFGSILALATAGYGVFAAFVTLYFEKQGWHGAALPLTLYGIASVVVRLTLGRWIDRYSVFRVGLICLAIELFGLALLATSWAPFIALIASCIIGAGFSLVFPTLCVPAILSVGPRDRASAISVYTAFMEVSLAIIAPIAGILISHSGFRTAFWAALVIVGGGFGALWAIFARSFRTKR